jgi:hypothetical protein
VESLEAALHRTLPECRPGAYRSRDAFEFLRPNVLKLEQVAHELPSTLRNDHGVGLRHALQTRRNVRRLANDGLLLRSAGADQITNDHQTR